MSHVWHDI